MWLVVGSEQGHIAKFTGTVVVCSIIFYRVYKFPVFKICYSHEIIYFGFVDFIASILIYANTYWSFEPTSIGVIPFYYT